MHESDESQTSRASGVQFCGRTRREFLWETGGGFTSAALASMLAQDGFLAKQARAADGVTPFVSPLVAKASPEPAKAKSVIFLFMYGGPSHVDTFDYKPELYPLDGKTIQLKTFGRGGKKNEGRVVGPKWKFKPYGQSGKMVSDLFPNLGTCVDDIAFVHSMYAESPIHGSAMLMMNSGRLISGNPCLGSWATYGLGTENQNLPGFVVMLDKTGRADQRPQELVERIHAGRLPGDRHPRRRRADPRPRAAAGDRPGDPPPVARPAPREERSPPGRRAPTTPSWPPGSPATSWPSRCSSTPPRPSTTAGETDDTKALYGIDRPETADFGRKCLLARRLVERGVRFVQVYSGGAHNDDNWDAHNDMVSNHTKHAGRTDKPIAGLIKDLKRRGLLDETLIVWGGEFGRQPTAEYAKGTGRDHNSYGFTVWLAGGGIKGGVSVGATDELGGAAVEDRFHVKNLHATILNQLGFDPNALSYFYGGLDQKLVGVEGAEPIEQII